MWLYPEINPVAIELSGIKIHWYGIMYLLGFLAAWKIADYRSESSPLPLNKDRVSDLIFYGVIGVILGGRLGSVFFYNFSSFLDDPAMIYRIWEGGMSFHGGLLGVLVAMYLFARKLKQPFFAVVDFVAPLVPFGLGMGRLGNFINAELPGRLADSDIPWAVIYPNTLSPRHPSSLYQFLTEGVLLFIILFIFSRKPRPMMAVSGMFLIFYGLFRLLTEFFREPDTHIGFIAFDWLTMGQLLSFPMLILGMVFILKAYGKEKQQLP